MCNQPSDGQIDPEKRRETMREVETILRDSAVMVQPFWPSRYTAAVKNVRG